MNESPLLLGVESSGGGLSSPFLGNGNAASSVVFIFGVMMIEGDTLRSILTNLP